MWENNGSCGFDGLMKSFSGAWIRNHTRKYNGGHTLSPGLPKNLPIYVASSRTVSIEDSRGMPNNRGHPSSLR